MSALRTTRRLLTVYAENEPRERPDEEARACLDIENKLTWGIHLFRGLSDLDVRNQSRAMKGSLSAVEVDQYLEVTPILYRLWLDASEPFLARAEGLARAGCDVQGLEEFRAVVEEARCLVENLEFEDEIRPIEELIERARPENPDPDRYRD